MLTPVIPNKNMAKFSDERLHDIEGEKFEIRDTSYAAKILNISLLSEGERNVCKSPDERLIKSKSQTFCKQATTSSKSSDAPFVDVEALKVLENKAIEVDRSLHRMMDNITRCYKRTYIIIFIDFRAVLAH